MMNTIIVNNTGIKVDVSVFLFKEEDVFHACGITTLTLPRSLKYVGRRTFDNALSLAYIKFQNSEYKVESEQGYPCVRIIYGYDNSTA